MWLNLKKKIFRGAIHTAQKIKFSIKDFPNQQKTADFVTFTEEILTRKLYFLCNATPIYNLY